MEPHTSENHKYFQAILLFGDWYKIHPVLGFVQDQNMLHNMREAAKKSSRTSAADTIAKEVLDLCIT